MATAAADSKLLLKTKKQLGIVGGRCSICGKKLKSFDRMSENPMTCWQCMIVNADS
jgi:exosome complex RNA-binding protein Csl4